MTATVRKLGEDDWKTLREIRLVDWTREQGHPRLLLWVYDAAPRAAAFYRRAGFTPTGRVEVFRNDGRPLTLMSMGL